MPLEKGKYGHLLLRTQLLDVLLLLDIVVLLGLRVIIILRAAVRIIIAGITVRVFVLFLHLLGTLPLRRG